MAESNIIDVNIPNGISIVAMAVVGGFLLSVVRKAYMNRRASAPPVAAA